VVVATLRRDRAKERLKATRRDGRNESVEASDVAVGIHGVPSVGVCGIKDIEARRSRGVARDSRELGIKAPLERLVAVGNIVGRNKAVVDGTDDREGRKEGKSCKFHRVKVVGTCKSACESDFRLEK